MHTSHCKHTKWAGLRTKLHPTSMHELAEEVLLYVSHKQYSTIWWIFVSIQMWRVWVQLGSMFSGICAVSHTLGGTCNQSCSSLRCTPQQCGRKVSFGHSCRWCMLLCRSVSTDPQTEEMNESSWQYIGQHHGHEHLQTFLTSCSPTKNRSHKHTTQHKY